MPAERFIPARRVQFQAEHIDPQGQPSWGWRRGEVVNETPKWHCDENAWRNTYRVRCDLDGSYWDVPASEATDITNEIHSD